MKYLLLLNLLLCLDLFADCSTVSSLEGDLIASKRDKQQFFVLLARVKGYKNYSTKINFGGFPNFFSANFAIELDVVKTLYGSKIKRIEYYPMANRQSELEEYYSKDKEILVYGVKRTYSKFNRVAAIHSLHLCSSSSLDLNDNIVKGMIFKNKCSSGEKSCFRKKDEITINQLQNFLDQYQHISLWDKIKRFFRSY